MNTSPKLLLVIVGPTAVGKTALAIKLAKKYHTEIISADSRQFFREMSIGTAKPSIDELNKVTHHFINNISITEEYNAGKFEAEALLCMDDLFKTHNVVIMVGGSGLYIDAVCNGFDAMPEIDEEVRKELNTLYAEKGITALQDQLLQLDPDHYNNVDLNNPQRIIRALEVCKSTGQAYSKFRKGEKKQRPFKIVKIGLNIDRELLYDRINKRVDSMMQAGLLDEVKKLLPHQHLNALQTVGYSELFEHLQGKTDLKTAIEKIKQNTRRFAKRQLTWFKRDAEIKWIEPNEKTLQVIEDLLVPN